MANVLAMAPPATSCSGRMSAPAPAAQTLGFSSSLGGCPHLRQRQSLQRRAPQHSLQVRSALSRKQKEDTVEKLVGGLQSSACVFGVRYKNVSVKDFQEFRRAVPQPSSIVVCKNTLMQVAMDKVDGWSGLSGALNYENAWVFCDEEVLGASVKAYMDFEKKLKDRLPREQRAKAMPTDISGGAMSGEALDKASVLKLEKMPTKLELIATVARLIKQVPTKVALGIKQVPTKLAFGVKALSDGDDKEALVGDTFPKSESS